MEDRNSQLLFEYLRSILYDSKVQKLNIEELDESFRKLGKGMQYLEHAVQEMKNYSAALSNGYLNTEAPSRENFLCENLKNIQANLNHLTWQAKQVAKGDYTQTVSYLGEFSDAFNTMTKQLREREIFLKEEARREKNHADVVENYNKLLLKLIARSEEDILVTSVEKPRILYCSKNNMEEIQNYELYRIFLEKQKQHLLGQGSEDSKHEWTWEAEDSLHHFYRVSTSLMEWEGEEAYAHIILEITKEKLEQGKLEQEAYFDKLTDIGNRYYFQKYIQDMIRSNEELIFCYCDLDHLKYINDHFGHAEGDRYLCEFVDLVKNQIREKDIFARMGGDEFCIVLGECSEEDAAVKLTQIQQDFARNGNGTYERNFSFGLMKLCKDHGAENVDEILQEADRKMYEQKELHRNLKKQDRIGKES